MRAPTTRVIAVLTAIVGLPVLLAAGYLLYTQGEKIHLRTDVFATPIPISRSANLVFTSVEIRGRLRRDGEAGTGTVVFAEEEYEFNEFGDRLRAETRGGTTFLAALRLVDQDGSPEEPRRLYEVTLVDGLPKIHIYLVLTPSGDHRLVLRMAEGRDPTADCQVLTLHDGRSPRLPPPDTPLVAPFQLTTRDRFPRPSANQYGEQFGFIVVRMSPDLIGSVRHDPNNIGSDVFGDARWITAAASPTFEGIFRQTADVDPTDAGRKVYDFVPANKTWWLTGKYCSLVLGRMEGDPHRLIVRERDKVRHVLALYVADENKRF